METSEDSGIAKIISRGAGVSLADVRNHVLQRSNR